MKVLTHLDPVVLERALLEHVRRAHAPDGWASTLVLVPTRRLSEHVLRRFAAERAAWIGLDVMTPRALARRILDASPAAPLQVASDRLLEALLERILGAHPDNAWSRYLVRRPGALRRLAAALADLREAGITPDELERTAGRLARDRALVELYRLYAAALERGGGGPTDEAGLVRAALPWAAGIAPRWGAVFLHGAYEWIGVHAELARALAAATAVTAFVPALARAPAAAYGNAFAERFLRAESAAPERLTDALALEQRFELDALYDERRVVRGAPGRASFRHTQGEPAEVRAAVRAALRAVAAGCPPCEIAIVARSLEPYAAALEEVFEDEALPWTSSLATPLRRQPVAHDFLLALEVLADDFPRRATAELLRSPRVCWRALVPGSAPPQGERADVWSRKACIVGGLAEWTRDLVEWVERDGAREAAHDAPDERAQAEARNAERVASARRIGAALAALRELAPPATRGWSAHAALLRRLLDTLFGTAPAEPAAAPALEALGDLLLQMEQLETFAGDRRGVPFGAMRAWLEQSADGTSLALRADDDGGIRVLDAMQARGLTFRRVHLLGLNSGLFPRPAREDPVLRDDWRARLAEATGKPLTVKSRGALEERLLLALLLGSATEHVEISWQRADESGRAKTPSLALREVARVVFGRPGLGFVRDDARVAHYPSHPVSWLETLAERTGLLSPPDGLLLDALHAGDAGDLAPLARLAPQLARGVAMLRATQAFDVVDPAYDARIGAWAGPASLSVSALGRLGRCPLQFFFERVLGVRPLAEPASVLEVGERELGSGAHAVLECVYAGLVAEGLFERGDESRLATRAEELLHEHGALLLGEVGPKLVSRLPVLGLRIVEAWVEALGQFLREDLARLAATGWRPAALESLAEGAVDFGEDVVQSVHGRFDRVFSDGRAPVVGDYKTGASLDKQVDPTQMLRALQLQVPLYALLAGAGARVELLGVGPRAAGARYLFEWSETEHETGFRETMRVLLRLARDGAFPLHEGDHCRYCDYKHACRLHHLPTIVRETEAYDDARDFRDLSRKGRTATTLAAARGTR